MSHDLKLARRTPTASVYDLQVDNDDVVVVDGFETAIIVSLMTDARAPESLVRNPLQRRGWVGDARTAGTGRQLGSLLWTFEQRRLTNTIINEIKEAARESLQWMVEDRIAKSVSVSAERAGNRAVKVLIDIDTDKGRGGRYSVIWRATDAI